VEPLDTMAGPGTAFGHRALVRAGTRGPDELPEVARTCGVDPTPVERHPGDARLDRRNSRLVAGPTTSTSGSSTGPSAVGSSGTTTAAPPVRPG